MILSGRSIFNAIETGTIEIEPFNENQLNPNSYDLRLSDKVIAYKPGVVLDCAKEPAADEYETIDIPLEGLLLQPGRLYLMSTIERTYAPNTVPLIEGRSSLARLGVSVHSAAGFGDVGFNGTWTLEVSVINPVRIYARMRVCQVYFLKMKESFKENYYHSKYQGQIGPKLSRVFIEAHEWK